jgi:hypothetical protein
MKREYDSDYANLISLETLSLIFWIETDKADTSSFLSDTWMYVTDSITYFNKTSVDEYFKKVRDKYYSSQIIPENWRSLYILLQEVIGQEKNIDDIDEDEFENAIDKINITIFDENSKLRSEVTELQYEIKCLDDEIKKSINTKIENNIIIPNSKI